jgi:integrase
MRTIKAKKTIKNGKVWHRVILPKSEDNPKPKQRWFRGKEGAEAFARELNEARSGQIRELAGLTLSERLLIAQAIRKAGNAQGVFDCVMMHADSLQLQKKSLFHVARECVLAKVAAGCRPAYLTPFELMMDRFVKHCGSDTLMSAVTLENVESFVSAPKMIVKGKERVPAGLPASWTRRARWIDLRTLFSFAVSRGYARTNLAEKLQPIRIDAKPPEILRPTQLRILLKNTAEKYPHLIPYVALCLFGGLRASEAQRVTWSNIGPEFIDLSSTMTKGRRRRLVTINPTLRAWLNLNGDLPIAETRARKLRDLLEPWPKNGLRHSFVSYSYVLHGAKQTSIEAGHSEDILHANYRQLVTRKAAEEFWALTPEVVLNNVIPLDVAA